MKKLLITGSTGFIGKSLINLFLTKKYKIFALTRKNIKNKNINYIKSDLFDHTKIKKIIKKIKPNYLIHLAWEANPKKFHQSGTNFKWLHSSLNLYYNFCKYGGRRALLIGSCAEYNFNKKILKEDFIKKTDHTRYSLCKETFLDHAYKISKKFNTQLIWARLFWIYGINQKRGRLIPDLIYSAKKSKKIIVKNPSSIVNLLNVKDVCIALYKIFESNITGIVNIADKKNIKVIDIVNKCKNIFKNYKLNYKINKIQYSKPYSVEIKKLSLIRFNRLYSLEKGLKEFL
ncbi:NAD(P)-dependent oxidoreductase [Candidatus Pelagibacter sp.]|nr:NAD(P)-dependent oxidoreductase [Candidatus Pelagibacter sp.]